MEEYVYKELKLAIFNRKIPLQTHLSEELLAEAFNVSRTPIRSVIKRLQYERIIQIIPNKGAFIYQPTQKEIEEVFHLRTLLEIEAIKFACKLATPEELEELESLTYLEEKLYKKGEYSQGIQVTSQFHQGVIEINKSHLMSKYSKELINITNIYLAFHDSANTESPLCPSEHREIIEAIRNKDEDQAVLKFLDHFNTVKGHLNFSKENADISFTNIFKPFEK